MRMLVILDSRFAHPGSAPIRDGKKGEVQGVDYVGGDKTSLSLIVPAC